MPLIDTEFFIARRIASRRGGRRNAMVRIATVTVAVGAAVMIVALAVVFGFKREIASRYMGFTGGLQIVNLDGNSSFETVPIRVDTALQRAVASIEGVCGVWPYALRGGIVKTDDAVEGVVLKGVDADYDWTFFRRLIVEGELPRRSDTVARRDALVSVALARLLEVGPGDRIEMLFVAPDRPARRTRLRVSGLFSSGMDELDRPTIVTDLHTVQRLNGWDDGQITGYEVNAADFSRLEPLADAVYDRIYRSEHGGLRVSDVRERYPAVFDWLRTHNVNAAVVIVVMLAVALLNMISALLIVVLERTPMIGVLKSLGMTDGALRRLFVLRSAVIVGKGLIWGNAVALTLIAAQKYLHFVRLDPQGYMLSEVPVSPGWWIVLLDAGAAAVLVLLMIVPAAVVSRIRPEKILRAQ